MQSIDQKLTNLLKPLFKGSKKEFLIINNLVKNWQEIIGEKYAQFCYPSAINFDKNSQAKLTIAVCNSAIGFVIENSSEMFLEKIACFYGYRAVHKIIIKQEPKPFEQKNDMSKKLSATQKERIDKIVVDVEDKELLATLRELGGHIIGEGKN